MKLILSVDPETYERIESGKLSVLYGRVPEIEIRQADGLLAFSRPVVSVVEMRSAKPLPDGVPEGPGLPVTVYLPYTGKEEA